MSNSPPSTSPRCHRGRWPSSSYPRRRSRSEFDADELSGALGVNGAAGLAGALSTFSRIRDCGRRFPFYWWKGDPTTYAMKPVTALVFREALGL